MDITPDGRMLFTAWRAGSAYSRSKDTWVATLTDLSAQSLGKRVSELAAEQKMDGCRGMPRSRPTADA